MLKSISGWLFINLDMISCLFSSSEVGCPIAFCRCKGRRSGVQCVPSAVRGGGTSANHAHCPQHVLPRRRAHLVEHHLLDGLPGLAVQVRQLAVLRLNLWTSGGGHESAGNDVSAPVTRISRTGPCAPSVRGTAAPTSHKPSPHLHAAECRAPFTAQIHPHFQSCRQQASLTFVTSISGWFSATRLHHSMPFSFVRYTTSDLPAPPASSSAQKGRGGTRQGETKPPPACMRGRRHPHTHLGCALGARSVAS